MCGPEWEQGGQSCSTAAETINGNVIHTAHRDVRVLVVSCAPVEKIEPFRKRMGWTFPWVSAFRNDFNRDFAVSFPPQWREGKGVLQLWNR
jgi:predicted dithiol-disulfide oxidoreductase (DUF899 family)